MTNKPAPTPTTDRREVTARVVNAAIRALRACNGESWPSWTELSETQRGDVEACVQFRMQYPDRLPHVQRDLPCNPDDPTVGMRDFDLLPPARRLEYVLRTAIVNAMRKS